ncbi:MAG: NifU family protein [Candidatus Omnitrophota bacterium]
MLKEQVEKVLDQLRPSLQADGGDVELVEVTDAGIVKLRLKGACGCCPMSTYTLKLGIEQKLKEELPEIKKVEQVK